MNTLVVRRVPQRQKAGLPKLRARAGWKHYSKRRINPRVAAEFDKRNREFNRGASIVKGSLYPVRTDLGRREK